MTVSHEATNGCGVDALHDLAQAPEWLALNDLRAGNVIEVLRKWRCSETPMSLIRRERRLVPQRTKVVPGFLCKAAKL